MLGVYSDFPTDVQKIVNFETSISETRLQKTLVEVFYRLNSEESALKEIAYPSLPECMIGFEFGIAEGKDFNYLDTHEKDRLLAATQKKPFPSLDFLCITRYYSVQNQRKRPLKFDHYMLRFRFAKKALQMQVFHEKGPMHLSTKDLPLFITKIVNSEFPKRVIKIIRES
jgi:hypothetical protein